MSANTMKEPPTTTRPILWPVVSPATTRANVESIAASEPIRERYAVVAVGRSSDRPRRRRYSSS